MKMDFKFFIIVTMIFYLICTSESRKHTRRRENRMRLSATSLSQKSQDDSPQKYSSWSSWSRCSKKCKKRRTRYCTKPALCGAKLLLEEKACFDGRCQYHNVTKEEMSLQEGAENHNVTSSDDFKILFHMPQLFSEWSTWTPCSESCMTSRTQKCLIPDACGQKTYSETAICYTKGSECQKMYGSRRSRKKSGNDDGVGVDVLKIYPLDQSACGVAPKASNSLDLTSKLRIIGGRETSHGTWPWQVAILSKHREPFCGGTIISPSWVLTAAHCTKKRLIVRSGEHNLLSLEGTEQESFVAEKFLHPDYNKHIVSNDIALLRLRKPFMFDNYTQAACLPQEDEQLEEHTRAIILGWGKKKSTSVYGTDHLHQAEVPIVGLEECRRTYANYPINDNMLCAGYKQGRVDSCAGDSGGPLLSQKEDKWTIYGITSFGDDCGKKGKYGIYSNVTKFVKWIKRTIAKFS